MAVNLDTLEILFASRFPILKKYGPKIDPKSAGAIPFLSALSVTLGRNN